MPNIDSTSVREYVATFYVFVLWGALLAGCAIDPYATPENTPPEVARACRALAATPREPPVPDALNVPGSADETLEDARAARREARERKTPGEVIYYDCLEENGVVLGPEQLRALERWQREQRAQ